jgi:hypothetical protein
MAQRTWTIVAGVVAASAILATSGVEREHPLLGGPLAGAVRDREARAAVTPGDPDATRALAQAYLDVEQPGLAVALLRDRAAAEGDTDGVAVRHLYARALMEDGKGQDALVVEEQVVRACAPLADAKAAPAGCDTTLFALAIRRVEILRELAAMGVTDVRAYPQASLVAYQNATREVRATLQ